MKSPSDAAKPALRRGDPVMVQRFPGRESTGVYLCRVDHPTNDDLHEIEIGGYVNRVSGMFLRRPGGGNHG